MIFHWNVSINHRRPISLKCITVLQIPCDDPSHSTLKSWSKNKRIVFWSVYLINVRSWNGPPELQYLPSKMIYHFTGLNHFSTKIYHFTGLSFYQDNLLWFHFPVYHFTGLSFFSKFGFIILLVYHFTPNLSLSFYKFILLFWYFSHRVLYGTVLPSLLFEFELTGMSFALPRRWDSVQCW